MVINPKFESGHRVRQCQLNHDPHPLPVSSSSPNPYLFTPFSPVHDGIWQPSQSPTEQPGIPCPMEHSTPPRRGLWPAGAQWEPQYPPCGSPRPRSVLERRAGRQVLSGLMGLCFGAELVGLGIKRKRKKKVWLDIVKDIFFFFFVLSFLSFSFHPFFLILLTEIYNENQGFFL